MTIAEAETLFEFPCEFPIKAMGKKEFDIEGIVLGVVRQHSDAITEGSIRARESKSGTFVSITVHIEAQSKAQLDAIYMDLTAHPELLMSM